MVGESSSSSQVEPEFILVGESYTNENGERVVVLNDTDSADPVYE